MELGSSVHNFAYSFDISKNVTNDRLYIYGVASTQNEDRDGETVSMRSLEKAFVKFMRRNPVLMFNHNGQAAPVGKVVSEFVGEDGVVYKSGIINNELHVVGMISQADSASDVRLQIEERILKSFSIGGRARRVQKGGRNCLLVGDLFEISIVGTPSNSDAMFEVIKSACTGDNCPINTETNKDNPMEVENMEKEEIVTLVKGVVEELKTADDYVELQKKYDALQKSQADAEIKVDADLEVDVIKTLTGKIDALTTEIAELRGTPIKKGIEDGEKIEKAAPTDITSQIVDRHYGGV